MNQPFPTPQPGENQFSPSALSQIAKPSNAIFASRNPSRNLLAEAYYSTETSRTPPAQRQAAAEIMMVHLIMVDIMMSNIMQKYVCETHRSIEELGLMRHNIKHHAKQLRTASLELQNRCNAHDVAQVNVFCRHIFQPLVNDYIASGGTLAQKMQNAFYRMCTTQIDRIFFATKNAMDKVRLPHTLTLTNIQMVSMMANTGIEYYRLIEQKIRSMMLGIGPVTCAKSGFNEKMLCSAKELLRSLGANVDMPEKECNDVRTLTAQFQRELVNNNLMKIIESSILLLYTEFIEFVIASLRMKIEEGQIPVAYIRTLKERLGSTENIRRLLKEISQIPLPTDEEWDIIDLMQQLPDSVEGSAIGTFRRLCLEDHVLNVQPEDETVILLRQLRQEARNNDGILPLGTLKQLYVERGTKQSVIDLLNAGGEELSASVKRLKRTKVSDFK